MKQLEAITHQIIDRLRHQPIPVGISNRHIHLTAEDYGLLFPDEPLSMAKPLAQPGHFSAHQCVTLIGPKGSISNVRILGPFRSKTQVEIASTNARELGVPAVIRQSGQLSGTPGIIVRGPGGDLEIKEGVIVAKRHIHMNPLEALILGLKDKQEVSVAVGSEEREILLRNVTVRVDPASILEIHLDTDEANAAGLTGQGDTGTIVTSGNSGAEHPGANNDWRTKVTV